MLFQMESRYKFLSVLIMLIFTPKYIVSSIDMLHLRECNYYMQSVIILYFSLDHSQLCSLCTAGKVIIQ